MKYTSRSRKLSFVLSDRYRDVGVGDETAAISKSSAIIIDRFMCSGSLTIIADLIPCFLITASDDSLDASAHVFFWHNVRCAPTGAIEGMLK